MAPNFDMKRKLVGTRDVWHINFKSAVLDTSGHNLLFSRVNRIEKVVFKKRQLHWKTYFKRKKTSTYFPSILYSVGTKGGDEKARTGAIKDVVLTPNWMCSFRSRPIPPPSLQGVVYVVLDKNCPQAYRL